MTRLRPPPTPAAPPSDVRARFAAAARQRTAIEREIAARADDAISTRLYYVALYFELLGWGGLAAVVLATLFLPWATSVGIGAVTIPLHARVVGLVWGVLVCGSYAVNGWLLRRRRRLGAWGGMATLGVAVLSELARQPTRPFVVALSVIGALLLASVWDETE